MNDKLFSGIITACITPFKNGKVDYLGFEKIILSQLQAGVNGVLLFGTTGEGLSLSISEKKILFLTAKRILKNYIPIIAGISEPVTANAQISARTFYKMGVDGLLVITPYYYKTTEGGVYEHFYKIARETPLPIIIYNVPTRTNYDLANNLPLLNSLLNLKNVVGIKQATTNLKRDSELPLLSEGCFLCGNDEFTFDLLTAGYQGTISVISNVFPSKIVQIYTNLIQGKRDYARLEFNKILPIIKAISCVPNPIGIKYLASLKFNTEYQLRLPLVADLDSQNIIQQTVNDFKGDLI